MNPSSNFDPREIAHFDQVAQLWWDADGEMGNLHAINPLRTRFITERIDITHARIADVGCGGGILSEALAQAGAHVTGIDLSETALNAARQHAVAGGLNIDYRLISAENLAQAQAGRFDAVTCMEMLEHVPEPAAVIEACARLLKPGGMAFFSTINRTAKAFLFAIVAGEYVLRMLPRGTHHYKMLIRPAEMRRWAATAGLHFVQADSLMYNPLTRRFRVAPGREDVNYMACFSKNG